jgi:glutathione S-transferase
MRFLASICQEPVGYPTATFHRAIVDRLLDWDLGTLYQCVSRLVRSQASDEGGPSPDDLDELNEATRFLDQKQLGDGRDFLTGNAWTIADLSCHMTLSLLRLIGLDIDDIPRIVDWERRMMQLPGWGEVDQPFQEQVADLLQETTETSQEEAAPTTQDFPEEDSDDELESADDNEQVEPKEE